MKTYIVEECAEILKCSVDNIYRLIKEDGLPAAKFGVRWVITEDNLKEYVNSKIKDFHFRLTLETAIREENTEFFERHLRPHAKKSSKWKINLPLIERLKLDGLPIPSSIEINHQE